MQSSKIGWLNGGNTFNPWIGCTPVSAACANCYAKRENARRGWCENFNRDRHVTSDAYWRQPIAWNKRSDPDRPTLVFCGSLCDVFEADSALYDSRRRLFSLIEATPNLLWLILTKRPHNVPWLVERGTWARNAWLGVTVENERAADERIPYLLDIPCAGRFVSCEPLLGLIDFEGFFGGVKRLDWVIAGGERGPGSRETTFCQFEKVFRTCRAYETPFFFKQFGDAFPVSLIRDAGKVFSEVQQYPKAFGIQ